MQIIKNKFPDTFYLLLSQQKVFGVLEKKIF